MWSICSVPVIIMLLLLPVDHPLWQIGPQLNLAAYPDLLCAHCLYATSPMTTFNSYPLPLVCKSLKGLQVCIGCVCLMWGLPLFLCQKSLPPGGGVSSASSSWSRHLTESWGSSCQRCRPWLLWQWQTSGVPGAGEHGSGPGDLEDGESKRVIELQLKMQEQHTFPNITSR